MKYRKSRYVLSEDNRSLHGSTLELRLPARVACVGIEEVCWLGSDDMVWNDPRLCSSQST